MKETLTILSQIILLISILTSCQNPDKHVKLFHKEVNTLLNIQGLAIEDSCFEEKEIRDIRMQVNKVYETGLSLDSILKTKPTNDIQKLCVGTFDMQQKSKYLNRNIFMTNNSLEYMEIVTKLSEIPIDVACWKDLLKSISLSNVTGMAQQAYATQYEVSKLQIEASEDLIFTEKEIREIVDAFILSYNKYMEMDRYFDVNPNERDAFDEEINRMTEVFQKKNAAHIHKIIHCENYEKLNGEMMEAMKSHNE
jgi:hypothetical protein